MISEVWLAVRWPDSIEAAGQGRRRASRLLRAYRSDWRLPDARGRARPARAITAGPATVVAVIAAQAAG